MCFALTEFGFISVNIPPSKMNQCFLAMSVPVAKYCDETLWTLKEGEKNE